MPRPLLLLLAALLPLHAAPAASACSDTATAIDLDGTVHAGCAALALATPGACAQHFCASCPHRGACDRTCEVCGDARHCPPLHVLDCRGRCAAHGAPRHALARRGDGACDDGRHVTAADGFGLDLNCPMHGCDGGDCEVCGVDPPHDAAAAGPPPPRGPACRDVDAACDAAQCAEAHCDDCVRAGACDRTCGLCSPPVEEPPATATTPAPAPAPATTPAASPGGWCVLLTATVAPAASMTHTVRRAPQLRAREYARALRDWAANASVPVVVVENSNANLTALRAAVGPGAAGRFEFVSPPAPAVPDAPSRGKGHAEYAALRWALLHARTLRQGGPCRRVLKVTGRYALHNLSAALAAVPPAARLVTQASPSEWTLWDGVVRTEVVGFANDVALADAVFAGQDERVGEPMERVVFVARERMRRADPASVASVGPFPIRPVRNAENDWVTAL